MGSLFASFAGSDQAMEPFRLRLCDGWFPTPGPQENYFCGWGTKTLKGRYVSSNHNLGPCWCGWPMQPSVFIHHDPHPNLLDRLHDSHDCSECHQKLPLPTLWKTWACTEFFFWTDARTHILLLTDALKMHCAILHHSTRGQKRLWLWLWMSLTMLGNDYSPAGHNTT